MKIELTDNEIKLMKEVLTNNSVRYAYESAVMKSVEPEWSKNCIKKYFAITKLLNKLNTIMIEFEEDYRWYGNKLYKLNKEKEINKNEGENMLNENYIHNISFKIKLEDMCKAILHNICKSEYMNEVRCMSETRKNTLSKLITLTNLKSLDFDKELKKIELGFKNENSIQCNFYLNSYDFIDDAIVDIIKTNYSLKKAKWNVENSKELILYFEENK